MTGVIVRSGANVTSGARTRLSTMLHGCWLLLFIVALPFALDAIPTTALAAMLVYTGFKLVSPQAVRQLRTFGLTEVWIYLATVGAIVATNLLEGVLLGLGLSLLKLLYTQARLRTRLVLDADGATLVLAGSATFLGLPKLAAELERVPSGTAFRLEFEKLVHIDHSCLELLTTWERQHRDLGGQAEIAWEALNRKYHEYRPSAVPA
jgi:MFS superfamily sulfate permease-like transporter